jgi:glucan biosynthesis protein C
MHPMMKNETLENHLPFMDAARGVLMSLGVILHGALVFSDTNWAIQNEHTSVFFTYIVDFIHLFRMPAFFIVSGFFCHMSLKRYGSNIFIKKRVPRIVVPMLVTALVLNTLQNLLLAHYHQQPISLLDSSYWLTGRWVSHLWFLHVILFYFLASVVLYEYAQRPLVLLANFFSQIIEKSKGGFLLVLPLGSLITLKISYEILDTPIYSFSISEAISFSLFFAFGALLNYQRNLLNVFIKPNPFILLFIAAILLTRTVLVEPSYTVSYVVDLYLTHLLTWTLCSVCFYIFIRLFRRPSAGLKYLAAASYSVYLFHHLLIIGFGIILINLELNIMVKFIILISLTYICTLAIHHFLILKIPALHYLFNGCPLHKRLPENCVTDKPGVIHIKIKHSP